MDDQEGPWPRKVTSIALWRKCFPKVCPSSRAYIIICGSGGLLLHTPMEYSFKFLNLSLVVLAFWINPETLPVYWFNKFIVYLLHFYPSMNLFVLQVFLK